MTEDGKIQIKESGVIVVCDLRNFTALSAKINSKEIIKRVEDFLLKISNLAIKYEGRIVNLTGDGIILEFYTQDPVKNALAFSLETRKQISLINKNNHREKKDVIQLGIGIYSGEYIQKDIVLNGQKFQLSLGEPINIASKIESFTKKYMVDILVGEKVVVENKNNNIVFLKMPPIKINGISKDFNVYWLAPQNNMENL